MFIAMLVDFANATTSHIQDTEPSPNENATNTVSLPSLDLSNNISESDTVNLSNNKGTSSSPIIHTSTTTQQITTFMFFGAIILQEILMCCIKGVLMVDLHLKIQST